MVFIGKDENYIFSEDKRINVFTKSEVIISRPKVKILLVYSIVDRLSLKQIEIMTHCDPYYII